MDAEVARLERLANELRGIQPPAQAIKPFEAYVATLRHQILLDQRTARAARDGDRQAIRIGMSQNQLNRNQRSRIASRLRLTTCLHDASSTG